MIYVIHILTVEASMNLKKIYLLVISKFIFYLAVLLVNMISKFHQYQEIEPEALKKYEKY